MSPSTLPIQAVIGGRSVSRDEVLAWEAGRATRVLRKLDATSPASDVATQRQALVARKLELGHEGIERLLATELRWSKRFAPVIAFLSRGRRRVSTIELRSRSGAAEGVADWYLEAMANDEASLLAACPDHYILRSRSDGLQEVVETPGGAPTAMRILLDPADTDTVKTPPDPAFPIQWVSAGGGDGTGSMGAIRHQFRDEPKGGFRARLTLEFPAATPGHVIRAHRWHLACEFSNWIEAANG